MTLSRDAERTCYKEPERKVDAANDRIADIYMSLQGSIITKLHHRDLVGTIVRF